VALVAADRGVRYAAAAEDPVLDAAARYRLANVLLAAGRPAEAQRVAVRAADLVDPARVTGTRAVAVWGGLLLTAAVAGARRGDDVTAWELLGEARTAGRMVGTDHADLYAVFGPTNVAIHGVQVAVELQRGRDAIDRSEQVRLDRLPGSLLERRGQYLIDLATAYVLERDDAQAVTRLADAQRCAPQEVRFSPHVHHLVRVMLARERTGATPGLRDLAARIHLAA
jgi:hypothetical protein